MECLKECGSLESIYEEDREGERELGLVKYTRGLGRKRILISTGAEVSHSDCEFGVPLKWQCSQKSLCDFEKSDLESLPHDILIKVLCFVDHEDLNQLFKVSKTIREASAEAEKSHFAYTTPKKVPAFRNFIDIEDVEHPNAPLRFFRKREIRKEDLTSVATVLFAEAEI